jgi:outer membrane protein assembly factor BamB
MAILAISGSGSGTSNGNSVAAGSAGEAYVGGSFKGTVDFDDGTAVVQGTTPNGGYQAGFVARYGDDGGLEWLRTAGGATSGNATDVSAVAVDVGDAVIAVGYFSATIDFDPGTAVPALVSSGQGFGAEMNHFVAKFESDGDLVWAHTADTSSLNERAEDVAIDDDGGIYVVGSFRQTVDFDPGAGTVELVSTGTGPAQDQDHFVLKYDTNGNLLWAVSSDASSLDETANAVAVDGDGNAIVAGDFTGTVDFDPGAGTTSLAASGAYDQGNFFLAKYDTDGGFQWALTADASSGMESATDVATDDAGNIFLAGSFDGTLTLDGQVLTTGNDEFVYNYFIAKYSPDGDLLWARTTGASTGNKYGLTLAVDGDGSVYLSGDFEGTVDFDPGPGALQLVAPDGLGGATNHFTAKYNDDGKLIWVRTSETAGDWEATGFEQARGSDIRDGRLYLTGSHWGTVDFDPGPGAAIVDSGSGIGAHFLTIQDLPRTTPPAPSDPNDTIPPDAPAIAGFTENTGNPSDHATTDRTLLIHGTAEPGALVTLYRTDPFKGELRIGTAEADAEGHWTFDHTATQLAIANYRFWAVATDGAGNESEQSEPFAIAVERDEPWAGFGGPGSIIYGHGFASDRGRRRLLGRLDPRRRRRRHGLRPGRRRPAVRRQRRRLALRQPRRRRTAWRRRSRHHLRRPGQRPAPWRQWRRLAGRQPRQRRAGRRRRPRHALRRPGPGPAQRWVRRRPAGGRSRRRHDGGRGRVRPFPVRVRERRRPGHGLRSRRRPAADRPRRRRRDQRHRHRLGRRPGGAPDRHARRRLSRSGRRARRAAGRRRPGGAVARRLPARVAPTRHRARAPPSSRFPRRR